MRYYNITLTNAMTGAQVLPSSLGGLPISSLLPSGGTNPAALNIEFDLPVTNYTPGNSNKDGFLRIWGLGLKDLTAAFNLTPTRNPVNVAISAGMSKGLPLANPAQQGLIMSGAVYQAWGNWIGIDQTLDMTFQALAVGSSVFPGATSFPFSWLKGTQLTTAIGQTLAIAMPNFKQVIAVSQNLVLNHDEFGVYKSLPEFSNFVQGISQPIIGGNYPGVSIATQGQSVLVFDTTKPSVNPVKAIQFQDMIGQPTWINPNEVTVKLVLRGDLNIFDTITLPPSLATQTQQSFLSFRDSSAFSGNYNVLEIEHYGNFRQPDAASWNTTIRCAAKLLNT